MRARVASHTHPLTEPCVVRLSLPNGWLETTNAKNLPSQLGLLWTMATGSKAERRKAQKLLDVRAAA